MRLKSATIASTPILVGLLAAIEKGLGESGKPNANNLRDAKTETKPLRVTSETALKGEKTLLPTKGDTIREIRRFTSS